MSNHNQPAGRDVAAILLLSMGEESAAEILKRLPREEVIGITTHMAGLPEVSNDEARDVIEEFFGRFREHSGIGKASRDYLEKTLDLAFGHVSKDLVNGIYGEELLEEFRKLDWIQSNFIAKCFKEEHLGLQAHLLAFMRDEKRAEVLDFLPEETHDNLIKRVAGLTEVNENIIDELKKAISNCIDASKNQNSARIDGTDLAAEIINHYKGNKQSLLEMLKHHDPDLAQIVIESMYNFSSLILQTDDTIQALIDSVELSVMAVALKGVDQDLKDKVFAALPKRQREEMTDTVEDMGGISVKKVEEAQKEIMDQARLMNEEGTIEYIIFEEKVVE